MTVVCDSVWMLGNGARAPPSGTKLSITRVRSSTFSVFRSMVRSMGEVWCSDNATVIVYNKNKVYSW